jgi:hypothetical protein
LNQRKKHRFFAAAIAAAAAFSLVLAACSASSAGKSGTNAAASRTTADMAVGAAQKTAEAASAASGSKADGSALSSGLQKALSEQKIIERLTYQIETLKFDESVAGIQSLCTGLGGYVQESAIDGDGALNKNTMRSAHYVLRLPQQNLSKWKAGASKIGAVLNVATSSENVTEQYYDTESRLKSLKAQQERLLELMKKADKMSDVVELEKALADVVYQIEQMTGALRQYDSLISYATVTVDLREVAKSTLIDKTPVTLGEKISFQFRRSLRVVAEAGEGLLVFVLGSLPILVLAAAVIAAILFFRRLVRAKKRKALGLKQKAENDEPGGGDSPSGPASGGKE